VSLPFSLFRCYLKIRTKTPFRLSGNEADIRQKRDCSGRQLCGQRHGRNHRWKAGGDLAWDECRSSSFSFSVPFPVSHRRSTHSRPHPFFLLPLNLTRRSGEALYASYSCPMKNGSQLQKLEGTKYTWSPMISEVGGDTESHGSRIGQRFSADRISDFVTISSLAARRRSASSALLFSRLSHCVRKVNMR